MGKLVWTDVDDSRLKELYDRGWSCSMIGDEIGKTRNAVIGRIHRLRDMVLRGAGKHQFVERPRKPRQPKVSKEPRLMFIKIKPRPEPELIRMRCASIEPLHIKLLDLEPHHCRYPFGDRDFTFCGHPKADGKSYCRDHADLVMGQGSYSERNAHKALLAA